MPAQVSGTNVAPKVIPKKIPAVKVKNNPGVFLRQATRPTKAISAISETIPLQPQEQKYVDESSCQEEHAAKCQEKGQGIKESTAQAIHTT